MTPSVLIFVVEDEALIRMTLQDALEEGGFAVIQAATAEEAIRLLDADGASFRGVITDVNLGSRTLTGWDVARRAREINANVPLIYMTGDSAADWAANGVPNSVLLTKPFAPAQVVTAVAHLLNTAPGE
jgi:DNA-binding response OmpR family regulator